MEQEIQRIALNEVTQLSVYKLFGLQEVTQLSSLEHWLHTKIALTELESNMAQYYKEQLQLNINSWNEQELSLNFIGPIFASISFTIPYKLKLFAQRPISAQIGNYLLHGKPDGIIASGYHAPEVPYFCFQEFKKEQDYKGDAIGQNLAAMLVGQQENEENLPMYGCYVVGRSWFFMTLEGKNYAISKAFSADDDEDILRIVGMLKALRAILFQRLGINGEW